MTAVPTIRTVTSGSVPVLPLRDAGSQSILLGGPAQDGSPLLMGITVVQPGRTSPLIEHDTAELAYVLSGTGWMVTDTAEHPFAPGDAVLIDAGCWHAVRAGEAPVEMLYVFPTATAPPTRTHPGEQG